MGMVHAIRPDDDIVAATDSVMFPRSDFALWRAPQPERQLVHHHSERMSEMLVAREGHDALIEDHLILVSAWCDPGNSGERDTFGLGAIEIGRVGSLGRDGE